MKVELAVGKLDGTWKSQEINVPEGNDPTKMSETELIFLLPKIDGDIVFAHLLYCGYTETGEEK